MSSACMSQVIVGEAFTDISGTAEKREVIAQLVEALITAGKLQESDREAIIDGAMARESIGSTGIGHGIAIPHCRSDVTEDIICAYGNCPEGVDFDSLDGEPVYCIFFLVTPNAKKEDHLALMKNFAGQIRKEHFCEFLRQSANAESLVNLLAEFENG